MMKLYAQPTDVFDVISGRFQTINAMTGLNAPRIADATAKLIKIAENDWRNRMFKPSKGASIPLSRALPITVSRIMRGNLIATYSACCGSRHQPIAAPYSPAPARITPTWNANLCTFHCAVQVASDVNSPRNSTPISWGFNLSADTGIRMAG